MICSLAQLYLPPEHLCTLGFMGQILSAKKKAFLNFEVCPIKVDYPKKITLKLVVAKVATLKGLLRFLPDDYQKHVTKDYLFTLVNTYDPSFFPTITEEVERAKTVKNTEKPQLVELDVEMLELLKKMQDFNIAKVNPRSLTALKVNARKRTRKAFEADAELTTMIDTKSARAKECKAFVRDRPFRRPKEQ